MKIEKKKMIGKEKQKKTRDLETDYLLEDKTKLNRYVTKMAPPKAPVMCLAKTARALVPKNLPDATLSSSCFKTHPIRCL